VSGYSGNTPVKLEQIQQTQATVQKMAKQNKKVTRARNTILSFVAVLVATLVGFTIYVSTGIGEGEISEGKDYRVLENPLPQRTAGAVGVIEFFSYACIHCKRFDPVIEAWAQNQGNQVDFRRLPVTFSPQWALLSQTYLTFEAAGILEENHTRMFRAIHDNGRQFLTLKAVADFIDGRGISTDEFIRVFNSPPVKRAVQDADRTQRAAQISATPQIVVGGQYVVNMDGGQRRALEVVEHLVATVRSASP